MNTWKENPLMLAEKLIERIAADGETSIDVIDARAVKLGIDMNVLDRALGLIHKNRCIKQSTKKGTIYYSIKVIKKKDPGSHLSWVRNNYPEMTPETDGSGIEADYSFMFLKPDEMEKYKAELQGKAYIPRKRRAKAKPVMSDNQLALIKMFT